MLFIDQPCFHADQFGPDQLNLEMVGLSDKNRYKLTSRFVFSNDVDREANRSNENKYP